MTTAGKHVTEASEGKHVTNDKRGEIVSLLKAREKWFLTSHGT